MNEAWAEALLAAESFGTTRPSTSTVKLAGLVLALSADRADSVTMATADLATQASLSKLAAQQAVKVLEETGWVKRLSRPRQTGSFLLRRPS